MLDKSVIYTFLHAWSISWVWLGHGQRYPNSLPIRTVRDFPLAKGVRIIEVGLYTYHFELVRLQMTTISNHAPPWSCPYLGERKLPLGDWVHRGCLYTMWAELAEGKDTAIWTKSSGERDQVLIWGRMLLLNLQESQMQELTKFNITEMVLREMQQAGA